MVCFGTGSMLRVAVYAPVGPGKGVPGLSAADSEAQTNTGEDASRRNG